MFKRIISLRKTAILLVIVATITSLEALAGCRGGNDAVAGNIVDRNLNLTKVIVDTPLDMIEVNYSGMTVSFNPVKRIPNYVAWELTATKAMGTEPRAKGFTKDVNVAGCPDPRDYSGSGYDRGHMAPAGDMKWSKQAMEESFMMTNVCPQVKSFNSGAWARLEEKCRNWALADSAIIIVAGPVMTDSIVETIGNTGIVVPQRFFKVVMSPFANPPRAIGFLMNNGAVEGGLQAAAVSVDEVEKVTGLDFFSELPDSIENKVEAECKFHFWSNLKPRDF